MTKRFIFLLLLCSLSGAGPRLRGQCVLRESTYGGFNSVIMENTYIQVIVLPDYNGLIAEYNYQPAGRNMFLPLELKTFAVSDKLVFNNTNYGGFKDWFWESGLVRAGLTYQYEVIRNTPKLIMIRLACDRGQLLLQRTLTLTADSTILAIDVMLEGKSREPAAYSYWAHNVLPRLENGDRFLIPLSRVNTAKRKGVEIFNSVRIDAPGIYDFLTIVGHKRGEYRFVPAQGWWGVLKNDGAALMQQAPDIAAFQTGDGFFYNSYHRDLISQEIVFPAATLAVSVKKSYRINYLAAAGFSGLDYASDKIFLHIEKLERNHAALVLTLTAAAPKQLDGGVLNLRLTDGHQEATVSEPLPAMIPGKSCSRRLAVTNPALAVPGTNLSIRFALNAGGQALETGTLLGHYAVP